MNIKKHNIKEYLPPEPPPWSFSIIFMSALLTACIFLFLPLLEFTYNIIPKYKIVNNIDTKVVVPPPIKNKKIYHVQPEKKYNLPKLQHEVTHIKPIAQKLNIKLNYNLMPIGFNTTFHLKNSPALLNIDETVFKLNEVDKPPQPIARLLPIYPPGAKARRIEGYVNIEFTVNKQGHTEDILVLDSMPIGVFEKTAEKSIKNWRFKPGIKNGQPVPVRVRQKLTFKLE